MIGTPMEVPVPRKVNVRGPIIVLLFREPKGPRTISAEKASAGKVNWDCIRARTRGEGRSVAFPRCAFGLAHRLRRLPQHLFVLGFGNLRLEWGIDDLDVALAHSLEWMRLTPFLSNAAVAE